MISLCFNESSLWIKAGFDVVLTLLNEKIKQIGSRLRRDPYSVKLSEALIESCAERWLSRYSPMSAYVSVNDASLVTMVMVKAR